MASNIEDNDVAKAFWENLSDADALDAGTKTALQGVLGLPTTFLKVDQTTPQTLTGGIPLLDAEVADFTSDTQLVNKRYVDASLNTETGYFFTNTLSSVGGIYYEMQFIDSGEAASTLTTGSLGAANDQPVFNFVNDVALGLASINRGVYQIHFHGLKTGTKTAAVYSALYARTSGGTETLLGTSLPDTLTTTTAAYLQEISLPANVVINTTDKLVVKFFVNVTGGGTNVTVSLQLEDDFNSRLVIPVESQVLSTIFLRQDENLGDLNDPAAAIVNLGILSSENTWTGTQIFGGGFTVNGSAVFGPLASFTYIGSEAAHRTALGLGTLATQSGTFSGASSGTNTGDQDLSGYMLKTAPYWIEVVLTNAGSDITAGAKVAMLTHTQAGTITGFKIVCDPANEPSASAVEVDMNSINLSTGAVTSRLSSVASIATGANVSTGGAISGAQSVAFGDQTTFDIDQGSDGKELRALIQITPT